MPKYVYICDNCGVKENLYKKSSNFDAKYIFKCSHCKNGSMKYSLPKNTGSATYRTNKFTGQQVKQGVEKQLKHRYKKHAAKYEYNERIDRHGLDDQIDISKRVDRE